MLIANDRVITAAHCVCTENYVGGNVCTTSTTVTFRRNPATGRRPAPMSGSVTWHPDYNPSWVDREIENDLAIIDLDGTAPSYAAPFDVSSSQVPSRSTVTIVGFGRTGNGCDMSAGTLNSDVVRISQFVDGVKIMQFNDPVFCPGDSGGAIFYRGKLVGVHSGRFPTIRHGWVSKSIALKPYFSWVKNLTCSSDLWNRCSRKGPICTCGAGIGDCDDNADCKAPNVCRQNVGATFGYSSSVDVCAPNGPLEGTCSCRNSGFANVCTPAINNCSASFSPVCSPRMGSGGTGCGGCSCQ